MMRLAGRAGRLCALVLVSLGAGLPARAQLNAEPSAIDLGARQEKQTVSAEVRLTNTGAAPLEILGVRADCSCTAGAPEKSRLAAGEATVLKISVETRGYHGLLHRNVRVITTDNELTIPITLSVSPFKSWILEPATIVLPASQKGREAVLPVTLRHTGGGDAAVGAVVCDPGWLGAAVAPLPQQGSYQITFTKAAGAPAGNHSVKVTAATSAPGEPELVFTVFVPVVSSLKASPNPVVLPTVKVGQTSMRELVLQGWPGAAAPRLELARGTARLLGHDGDRWHFEVAETAAAPGPSTQLLRVYDGDSLEAELPVILRVEPDDRDK